MAPLLELEDVHTAYGTIEALKGISLKVEEGEVVTLIGSNGAGKSTTLRSISGLTPPRSGSIRFRGQEISTVPAQEIVRLGISQSPEGRRCFQRMTVRENLELGAYLRRDANVTEDMDRVLELFPRLREREKQKAGTMSGGEQQMLAMGRALMANPALLLLDEPSMGLAPILVDRIYETVREINKQGTTILLVEQNANYALDVSSARVRARDGPRRAGRQVRGPPGEPGGPERLPGDVADDRLRTARLDGAVAPLRLAAVGHRRLVPVGAQGLRRARRAGLRAAAQCRRRDRLADRAAEDRSRCGRRSARSAAGGRRSGRTSRRRRDDG